MVAKTNLERLGRPPQGHEKTPNRKIGKPLHQRTGFLAGQGTRPDPDHKYFNHARLAGAIRTQSRTRKWIRQRPQADLFRHHAGGNFPRHAERPSPRQPWRQR